MVVGLPLVHPLNLILCGMFAPPEKMGPMYINLAPPHLFPTLTGGGPGGRSGVAAMRIPVGVAVGCGQWGGARFRASTVGNVGASSMSLDSGWVCCFVILQLLSARASGAYPRHLPELAMVSRAKLTATQVAPEELA